MPFAETRATGSRRIINGVLPVIVTLSEAVQCGDVLGVTGGTWVRSAHTTGEQPLLVASVDAPSGDIIKAFPLCIVEVTTTAANKSTVGEIVALSDTGNYQAAGTGLPDIGFTASIGGDNLTAVMVIFPMATQMDTART